MPSSHLTSSSPFPVPVEAPYEVMRLLECISDGFTFKDFDDSDTIPPYAILSHTWNKGDKVIFNKLTNGTGRGKKGYKKIEFYWQQPK